MNKKQIIKWTEEDKAKLVEQVQMHTQNNRTSWNQVSLAMNRTPNQCKTYYTIVIKQLEPKQVNMKWDLDEFIRLITTVSIYGKKWELIRKLLEFKTSRIQQLYS
ncbi:Myb-like_DNA-binding domain-containing protein [Hexamita inflata]|uniref:Myb-like DNA-binding domain-containing protein n=1 Tax=Hexamita inflata TaxID=28002 RepID=A0AA86R2C6_9EUKA|nr:Myb-like DNA-binding domain-containing protein [Hexamita inflata]